MEYADEGDCYRAISESFADKVYLKEKMVWKIIIQVLKGLRILHDLNIVHRDMKSANIFLFSNG